MENEKLNRVSMPTYVLKTIIKQLKPFLSKSGARLSFQYINLSFDKETSTVTAYAVDGYRAMQTVQGVTFLEGESFSIYLKPFFFPKNASIMTTISEHDGYVDIDLGIFAYSFKPVEIENIGDFDFKKTVLENLKEAKFTIAVNPKFLCDALKDSKEERVYLKFTEKLEPIVIKSVSKYKDNAIRIVLPVRFDEEES